LFFLLRGLSIVFIFTYLLAVPFPNNQITQIQTGRRRMTRPVMILVGKQLLAAGLHEMTA
jgi:hypothetical protein